jgi:hypothetical protein
MRNRVYIAGKVSGLNNAYVRANFTIKKLYLQEAGYEVFCPIDVCQPHWSWIICMTICIFNLIFRCNKISLLPNWKHSRGEKIEYKIAKFLKYRLV